MDKDTDGVDKRVDWLHSEQHSAGGNIFGEPQKTMRIGVEYQAQIPSLMTKNERYQLMKVYKSKEETMETEAHVKGKSGIFSCGTDNNLLAATFSSSKESWSAIEHDSFILGLYIFGKNLRVVNKFMGNKGLPNVLSYYYGKFYKSSEHQKWSMYRKKRVRIGKKIFNGWRLHELLSRLLSNVTDECKASLTQVIKMFEEGKLTFEKYVFSLRDSMGLDLLVQAVAIGKGKQDLTIKTRTRLRSKKVQSTCSSLKTEEIINILKDRIGLSKPRLKEFFWAAVWPRLVARGWHYEESINYAFQDSKNLVFLAPGVIKFSRRSLVKGSQYFESLTEVLNKVASEPRLLEPELDKNRLVVPHVTAGSDDELDLMKCTVVDTDLVGVVKVKELTSLTVVDPADNIKNENTSSEDEAMKDAACFETVIDLNKPRARPGSDDDNINKSVLSEPTTNQIDSSTPVANGQRQSRRNRALTTKALEALENGLMNPKKTRRRPEDGARRRVRSKMSFVSSCDAHRDFHSNRCDSTSVLL
ncbi:uncharacterized protein LOC143571301 [Bidens hawaiensis]|uniref:uncharacterized protein LOC143571301 n=1 Tax=Bidens hawaiensis TaxID=980011 RepID=UPI00404A01DC